MFLTSDWLSATCFAFKVKSVADDCGLFVGL
jgi:hypothetical protein